MSKPKEYSFMTKDKLMTYTFIALLIITIITAVMWSQDTPVDPVTKATLMNMGLTVAIMAVITTGIAVGVDFLIAKVASDDKRNTMSAAVFGLIVTLCYSLGVPNMASSSADSAAISALSPPEAFYLAALMSVIGLVVFKKVAGLAGRKFVNPAAVSNLIVLLPFVSSVLLAGAHYKAYSSTSGGLSVPLLAGPIGNTVINHNGLASFVSYLEGCYSLSTAKAPNTNMYFLMLIEKFHGWAGGASSLAVIIVGIGLFIVARKYIKWRITVTYLVTVAVLAMILTGIYGGDAMVRLLFELFIGSSIFLAFFMATDPATTPLTYTGQIIFGVGLGILAVLIQTYMNFWGGSILALVIMNLTSSSLDKVGRMKPTTESKEPKLPKAQAFTAEQVSEYQCIRCGACMRVCCHKLSPIVIKQAFDKMNFDALQKLNADYCTGCGHCTFVCPARIDLRKSILQAKGAMRQQ